MHPDDLLLVAGLVALSVLTFAGIGLAVWSTARRDRVFHEVARARGLAVTHAPSPWSGEVARGIIDGRALEMGPIRLGPSGSGRGFIRFRVAVEGDRLPRGIYLHSQSFRHNAAGPRSAHMPRYDGSADDPATRGLIGSVPEIVLGETELDRAFVVQGDDEAHVRALLFRPPVRTALLAAIATGGHLRIRAGSGAIELDVVANDLGRPAAYDAHFAQLVHLASVL